jgi:hypothetical protein
MSQGPSAVYRFGPYVLDVADRSLKRDGASISLTPKQFDRSAATDSWRRSRPRAQRPHEPCNPKRTSLPQRTRSPSCRSATGLGHAFGIVQDRREARRVLAELERVREDKGLFAYEIGLIHAALGEKDAAFEWFSQRSGWIAYLHVDPRLDELRTDPRFQQLQRSPASEHDRSKSPHPRRAK